MEIKAVKHNGIIAVTITGHIDANAAMQLEQAFLKYSESGSVFVLDFSGVDFIGSAGLRALVTLYRIVDEKGGSVTIAKPCKQVLDVLIETDLLALFTIE